MSSVMLRWLLVIVVAMGVLLTQASLNYNYACSVCVASLTKASKSTSSVHESCLANFPERNCGWIKSYHDKFDLKHKTPRANCEFAKICTPGDTVDATGLVDIRVVKAIGSQGYNKVRISVLSNRTVDSDLFTYKAKFKYRWTEKFLSTGLVPITPGTKTTIQIADSEVNVLLPKQGVGTRGVIISDPCFTSEWCVCSYAKAFNTFRSSLELLNAINAFDDVSYWQILGDNFYDQQGFASSSWFAGLSSQSKSKMFATVPGNHDFWIFADPDRFVPKDQLGNGFMQFYAQDTIAATATSPFDFSFNPDAVLPNGTSTAEVLPAASNYFFYNQVGNTGFIGYSGAHSYQSMLPYFTEACTWAAANADTIDVLLLLGHWHLANTGCPADSPVPVVYKHLATLPACAPVHHKLRYFMGHTHCNVVTKPNIGFMVGAQGVVDGSKCGGAYGIPVVDTTDGRFRVYYFPIAQGRSANSHNATMFNNYDAILSCIKASGVSGCYHLATLWADVRLQ